MMESKRYFFRDSQWIQRLVSCLCCLFTWKLFHKLRMCCWPKLLQPSPESSGGKKWVQHEKLEEDVCYCLFVFFAGFCWVRGWDFNSVQDWHRWVSWHCVQMRTFASKVKLDRIRSSKTSKCLCVCSSENEESENTEKRQAYIWSTILWFNVCFLKNALKHIF